MKHLAPLFALWLSVWTAMPALATAECCGRAQGIAAVAMASCPHCRKLAPSSSSPQLRTECCTVRPAAEKAPLLTPERASSPDSTRLLVASAPPHSTQQVSSSAARSQPLFANFTARMVLGSAIDPGPPPLQYVRPLLS